MCRSWSTLSRRKFATLAFSRRGTFAISLCYPPKRQKVEGGPTWSASLGFSLDGAGMAQCSTPGPAGGRETILKISSSERPWNVSPYSAVQRSMEDASSMGVDGADAGA